MVNLGASTLGGTVVPGGVIGIASGARSGVAVCGGIAGMVKEINKTPNSGKKTTIVAGLFYVMGVEPECNSVLSVLKGGGL